MRGRGLRTPFTAGLLPPPPPLQVARKENLNVIQTELRKLEQSMHDIHVELQLIRRKEVRPLRAAPGPCAQPLARREGSLACV